MNLTIQNAINTKKIMNKKTNFTSFIFDDGNLLVQATNNQLIIGCNSPLFMDDDEKYVYNELIHNEYLSIDFMFNSLNQITLYNKKDFESFYDIELLLSEFYYQLRDMDELFEITNKKAFGNALNLLFNLTDGRMPKKEYIVLY